jgi:hypothetical protein
MTRSRTLQGFSLSWKGTATDTDTEVSLRPFLSSRLVTWTWYWQEMYERDCNQAIQQLSSHPGSWIHTTLGDAEVLHHMLTECWVIRRNPCKHTIPQTTLERGKQYPDGPRFRVAGIAHTLWDAKTKLFAGKRQTSCQSPGCVLWSFIR